MVLLSLREHSLRERVQLTIAQRDELAKVVAVRPSAGETDFYDLTPGACYLFRPDQHISARWRTLTKVRVRTAVERATAQRVPETVK